MEDVAINIEIIASPEMFEYIKERLMTSQPLIEYMRQLRHTEFWDNSRGWSELNEETILIKNEIAERGEGLAAYPETINIRFGNLAESMEDVSLERDTENSFSIVDATQNNGEEQEKILNNAELGRPVDGLTENEKAGLIDFITHEILDIASGWHYGQ